MDPDLEGSRAPGGSGRGFVKLSPGGKPARLLVLAARKKKFRSRIVCWLAGKAFPCGLGDLAWKLSMARGAGWAKFFAGAGGLGHEPGDSVLW
jgi:hypothetical protein